MTFSTRDLQIRIDNEGLEHTLGAIMPHEIKRPDLQQAWMECREAVEFLKRLLAA